MANTLTALAPTLFSAAQEVQAEPFGLVDAINTNFDNKGVAVGDSVTVPVAPVAAGANFTAAAVPTLGTDAIASSVSVTIDKSRKTAWHLTGEQIRSLENGGNYQEWVRQLIGQGMRTLRNECEADAATALKIGASRATGTAGTAPFATSLDDLVNARKILRDNGAPMSDLQCVVNTSAEVNLFKLGIVQQAYAAGSDTERRNGILGRQFGFTIGSSAGLSLHTKGTMTGADCTAIEPIGETSIAVDGSDSGTILAGDIIYNNTQDVGGALYKYVVSSGGTATGAAAGSFSINKTGVRTATAVNDEWVIGGSYTPNFAFERDAVVGVIRPPMIPASSFIRQMPISDGKGMTYLLLEIDAYGAKTWELHLAWGFKVVQPEYVATILG